MTCVFLGLLYGPNVPEAINFIEIMHQGANHSKTACDLPDGRVLLFQAFDAEEAALPQHPICNIQHDYISLLHVFWWCVLNMTFNYGESF